MLSSTHSTNRLALDLLSLAPHLDVDAWIFALHQRQGSGRFGRSWASPSGAGVYASLLLRVRQDALGTLPMVVGVGLCEALSVEGFDCRLKWPNDLQLNGKKVGGILLQSRCSQGRVSVVVGFGVNHTHQVSDLPRIDCTSLELSASARLPSLAEMSTRLADAVEGELDLYRHALSWGSPSIVERYRTWSVHRLGDRLEVANGGDVVSGEFAGFSAEGHLRLRTPSGERLLVAGELGGE